MIEGSVGFEQSARAAAACPPLLIATDGDFRTGNGMEDRVSTDLPFLALELTRQCNLQCRHCYVFGGPRIRDRKTVSLSMWRACLAEAFGLGIRRVQFIGGEVALHPGLETLLYDATEIGFEEIELYTNATLLSDSILNAILESGAAVATSLYGGCAEDHDAFTRAKGSFSRTCRNIERLVDDGVRLRVAVVRQEGEDRIFGEGVAAARGLGVKNVSTAVVRAFGRAASGTSRFAGCAACGTSVLRACPDGSVSGCSMSPNPRLGHIETGLGPALMKLMAGREQCGNPRRYA